MLNQPAAKDRPNGGGDRGEPRPRSDRLTTTLLVERRTDNRKTAGHQKCSSHTLNAPGDDEQMDVRGSAATRGSQGKNRDTYREYQTTPKQIPERTAN